MENVASHSCTPRARAEGLLYKNQLIGSSSIPVPNPALGNQPITSRLGINSICDWSERRVRGRMAEGTRSSLYFFPVQLRLFLTLRFPCYCECCYLIFSFSSNVLFPEAIVYLRFVLFSLVGSLHDFLIFLYLEQAAVDSFCLHCNCANTLVTSHVTPTIIYCFLSVSSSYSPPLHPSLFLDLFNPRSISLSVSQ